MPLHTCSKAFTYSSVPLVVFIKLNIMMKCSVHNHRGRLQQLTRCEFKKHRVPIFIDIIVLRYK